MIRPAAFRPRSILFRCDHHLIVSKISSDKSPLNPRFSVLALFPQMTRESPNQPTVGPQNFSHGVFPTQIPNQQSAKSEAGPAADHHAKTRECERHLGEEKANRNIRITEIELCIGKHATKQFSNRNKNAFFAFLNAPEIREKRP
jgi:hypothetical protein